MVRITSNFARFDRSENFSGNELCTLGRVPPRRKTHQRVHHQNVDDQGDVSKSDIVKGFEYAKNKYTKIDPEELNSLRLPTVTTMQIRQFVKADELSPSLFERPYFVAPKDEVQAKALGIMRKALVGHPICDGMYPTKERFCRRGRAIVR